MAKFTLPKAPFPKIFPIENSSLLTVFRIDKARFGEKEHFAPRSYECSHRAFGPHFAKLSGVFKWAFEPSQLRWKLCSSFVHAASHVQTVQGKLSPFKLDFSIDYHLILTSFSCLFQNLGMKLC